MFEKWNQQQDGEKKQHTKAKHTQKCAFLPHLEAQHTVPWRHRTPFTRKGFFFRPLLNRRTAPRWHVSLALRGSANANRARKNTTGCHAGGAKHGARGLVPTCATYVLAHALIIGGVTTSCLPLLRDDTAR